MAAPNRPPAHLRLAVAAFVLAAIPAVVAACSDDAGNVFEQPTPTNGVTVTPGPGFKPLTTYTVVYESTIIGDNQTSRAIHTLVLDPPQGLTHIQHLNEYAGQVWFIYDETGAISCSKGRSDAGSCWVVSTNTPSPSAAASAGTGSDTAQTPGQTDIGSRTIAGRTAHCFEYAPTGPPPGPSEMCFDAEWSVMLYVKAPNSELIATSVLPTADPGAFVPPFPVTAAR